MPRRPRLATIVILALLAFAGCRESGEGAYFGLDGKVFVFNYRVATATYLVNLKPLRPVDAGQAAIASFEDPAGGAPIVVRKAIWPKVPRTTIESPPLRCVVKDRPYAVTIRIEDAAGTVRQIIQTTVTSSQNQADFLPDAPLVVGPAYTTNPELAGRPDGRLPADALPPCPGE